LVRTPSGLQSATWSDFFVGLFFYFSIHYTFFTILVGQIVNGFSAAICVELHRLGGSAPVKTLLNLDLAGVVLADRVRSLEVGGYIAKQGNIYQLTALGRVINKLNQRVLSLFGVEQTGKASR
jgi:hypothetical protein